MTHNANKQYVVLQLPNSIDDIEDSENSQSQSSIEMYSTSIKDNQDEMSICWTRHTINEGLYNRQCNI